jgi:protein involved in polysaccharide export with SLBB domain
VTVVIGNSRASPYLAPLIVAQPPRRKGVFPSPRSEIRGTNWVSWIYPAFYFLILNLLFIGLPSAAGAQGPPTRGTQDNATRQESLVHYGDLIDVDVVGGFEFDWRGTLTPEGNLDGITTFDEPVFALCRSEKELGAEIAKRYSKILRDPKVEVRIVDRSNRAVVRVDGAVRTPTRFSIRRQARLNELLILAGGLVSGASGNINIIRPGNLSCQPRGDGSALPQENGSQTINITIKDLLSGINSANPVIVSGDIVTVSRAFPVYVIGAVNNPGAVYADADLTVSRAIASAGGLTKEAQGNLVTLFRREKSGTVIVEIDLAKIRQGEMEDEVLRSFDIIDVVSKVRPRRTIPPASPVLGTKDFDLRQMPLKIVD